MHQSDDRETHHFERGDREKEEERRRRRKHERMQNDAKQINTHQFLFFCASVGLELRKRASRSRFQKVHGDSHTRTSSDQEPGLFPATHSTSWQEAWSGLQTQAWPLRNRHAVFAALACASIMYGIDGTWRAAFGKLVVVCALLRNSTHLAKGEQSQVRIEASLTAWRA